MTPRPFPRRPIFFSLLLMGLGGLWAVYISSAKPTPLPSPTSTPFATPSPSPKPVEGELVERSSSTPTSANPTHPTLADFWEGRAMWKLDQPDVGLPMGESDTIVGPDGELWSYLHASFQSAGVRDQWETPVSFPGCVTLWKSSDGGKQFALTDPYCLPPCLKNPCTPEDDQIDLQQYPRVALAPDGTYVMVYEWRGWDFLRTSPDGLNWSAPEHVGETRQWYKWFAPCSAAEVIGPHPFVNAAFEYECFLGGPPGIYIEGDQLYIFIGMGKHPSHMGCFVGPVASGAAGLRECAANPLFTSATSYGPPDASGPAANPYFDFRIISSADVLRVGDHYYMSYEGVRGPDGQTAQDNQFNLGFARSLGPQLDGPWEKYPANPVLMDVPGNIGVGHADLIILEGVTYLYTATSDKTRGRYELVWKPL